MIQTEDKPSYEPTSYKSVILLTIAEKKSNHSTSTKFSSSLKNDPFFPTTNMVYVRNYLCTTKPILKVPTNKVFATTSSIIDGILLF